jgi:ribosomal protein S18 acetylase RimI-like enzyme
LLRTTLMIRAATLDDLDALVELENNSFNYDRISRRSFRHLLTKGHAITLVYEMDGQMAGYILALLRQGISLARIYSLAIHPDQRGKGIGKQLAQAAEAQILAHDCVCVRLEIRPDNTPSIRIFESLGYRVFDSVDDYYEDHSDALRFEKFLMPKPELVRVPFYAQTLDFTCGPAALMMAMKALDPSIPLDRKNELRIWRESTTIFMTSGHGGCGPHGLALAAHHRGFDVELHVNDTGALFMNSVRSPEKRDVMRLVQEDFIEQMQNLLIPLHYGSLKVADLEVLFEQGAIPLVLISYYQFYQEKFPHWVVVTGFDSRFVYINDSFVDARQGETITDCVNIPISKQQFDRMARYGKSGQKAVLLLRRNINANTSR